MASWFWKSSFEKRLCVVPATSFCEPHAGRKPATLHWFAVKGNELRQLFAFAGIWQRWKGPIKKDGPNVDINTYSWMTTELNSATSSINHERSPLLLMTDEERDTWLDGTQADAAALVRPISVVAQRIVHEGFEKKDVGSKK